MKPMMAQGVEIGSKKFNDIVADGYIMEPKLDGVRAVVFKRGNEVKMMSRSGKTDFAPKVPHLTNWFRSIADDFVLDGELGYVHYDYDGTGEPLIDFNKTARVTGSGDDVALSKQDGNDQMMFVAFDLLEWNGVSFLVQPYTTRRTKLHAFLVAVNSPTFITMTTMLEHWDEQWYNTYVEAGGEGVMLKNPLARYNPDTRLANNWYKVKKWETIDVVIDDYTEGLGKYTGQIGAIIGADAQGNPVVKCSGMTDEQRVEFTERWPLWKGKVMEVKHFGKVGIDEGGYRHPQFLRVRFDKLPEECIL
jgi:ATP-dependent DNA ligase